MAKNKTSEEAVTVGAANLEAPKGEATTSPKVASEGVMYWSPFNAKLGVVGKNGLLIQFVDHVVNVRNGGNAHGVLESHSSKGKDFLKVLNQPADADTQKRMLKYLRNMVESDGMDQVSPERGYIAVSALFSASELDVLGISYSSQDVDALMLAAINNKTIEGI